jgi:DNA-binding LacI/PurR family transcriptional regulator
MSWIAKTASTPIYRQIFDHFRAQILDGTLPEGAPLPSIRYIQHELGVGAESVKRALNDLSEQGFVRKIQGKGVFAAHRERRERFWGIVVPFYADFYNQAIVELRRVAAAQNTGLEHACDYDNWRRQIEIARDFVWHGAEAVIVVPTRDEARTLPHFQRMARHLPVVLFDRSSIASQLPYVIQDYVLAVRVAMQNMCDAGAQRIAYVRDPLWSSGNPIYQTMEAAYSETCSALGLHFEHIYESPHDLSADELRAPDFDGLLCVNDQIACLMVGMLRENGVDLPGRVQVVGNNNAEVGRFFTPQITTTCPDLPRMCGLVADIIRRCLEGEKTEFLQHVVLPRLIVRGTTRNSR